MPLIYNYCKDMHWTMHSLEELKTDLLTLKRFVDSGKFIFYNCWQTQ